MKKIILSALFIGGAAAVHAQANSVLVFGQLGIHSTKDAGDNKNFRFDFNPGVGYQFNDNWTVGLTGSFGTNRSKPDGATDWSHINTYSAGAFLRYTMPVGKIFAFYNQLEALYIGSSTDNNGPGVDPPNVNGFRASLTPAVAIMVHDGFALNFGFGGIDFTTQKVSGANSSTNSFNLTWGTQFNIGVSKNILCGRHRHHKGGHKMNHGSRMEKEEMEEDKKESED